MRSMYACGPEKVVFFATCSCDRVCAMCNFCGGSFGRTSLVTTLAGANGEFLIPDGLATTFFHRYWRVGSTQFYGTMAKARRAHDGTVPARWPHRGLGTLLLASGSQNWHIE